MNVSSFLKRFSTTSTKTTTKSFVINAVLVLEVTLLTSNVHVGKFKVLNVNLTNYYIAETVKLHTTNPTILVKIINAASLPASIANCITPLARLESIDVLFIWNHLRYTRYLTATRMKVYSV